MKYHSNDELRAAVELAVAQAGEAAEIEELGRTVGGEAILAAHLGVSGDEKPQLLVAGNLHGAEVIGSEVALAVLEHLCAEDPHQAAAELRELADITIVPAVNLDSRKISVDGFLSGRWRYPAPRGNAHGVDLNRNFPLPKGAKDVWYPLSGTTISWLPWYRGPQPLSEPEARALADLAERRKFAVAVNFHSVSRLFLYPYCYTHEEPEDLALFLAMGEAYIGAQPFRPYKIKQSRSWYAILGDLDDYLYDTFGTLSVTIEVSTPAAGVGLNPFRLLSPFALMNPRDPRPTIDNNVQACIAALTAGVRLQAGAGDIEAGTTGS